MGVDRWINPFASGRAPFLPGCGARPQRKGLFVTGPVLPGEAADRSIDPQFTSDPTRPLLAGFHCPLTPVLQWRSSTLHMRLVVRWFWFSIDLRRACRSAARPPTPFSIFNQIRDVPLSANCRKLLLK